MGGGDPSVPTPKLSWNKRPFFGYSQRYVHKGRPPGVALQFMKGNLRFPLMLSFPSKDGIV
jgi:hypothetical protein